ncbi:ARM repeat superfamily protein [Artemisia annua]|uniref:ARM repeat superfamily protein n=1 Tax=Artemisia annua TaxID=35608 RepID=A0A2U1N6E4_ARTAN|nr:ARM repeat superfamily protein [Artemisia annua]
MSQSLELLLIQFLMPDNDARRQAEDQIKRLAKDPQVVPALVHHLRTAKTPNVRQLAAVLLRKKITGHWPKLSAQLRQLVKQSLIESITLEHSPPVRRASANVVSIIAKYAVPTGEWPDLLPFLFQCSQSAQEDHREVALILFSSLTETIGESFKPYFADLQALLLKCLQDETSNSVRVAALKAVGSFIEFTTDEDEVIKFREFIPSILNVSRQCLASGDEDVAIIAFEIFDELIESPAPLLGDTVKAIVQFSLEVCSSPNLDSSTRHQAIQIISWLAKYKSSSLKKHKLIIPILQVLCPLLTEASNRDEDDDLAPDRAAAEVLDTLSLKIPKHVFPPVLEFATLSSQSVDPKFREASVTVLGVVSEGCFELMKEKLGPVLHIVLGALRDPEQVVRGASSFALGQFAEYLQPEITSHYETVLPSILNALEDSSDDVKSAIGSVASAAEQAFLPYAERVLELMKNFMVLTNDEDLCSRARATELVGIVAMVVGRARMEPILPPFIEAAISGFGLEYSELREYTHGFFSNVAEILEDGFVQYLPHVVPLALSSCNLDDGCSSLMISRYLEESLRILVKHSSYFHEDVRLQAITGLKTLTCCWFWMADILIAAHAVFQGQNDGAPKAKELLDSIMTIYIKTMNEDDDKEVVAQACVSVADIIKDFGYVAVETYMPQIVESTLVLLRQQSKGSRSAQDRTMVVACLAEVAQDMGAPIATYVDAVMPLVLKELGSSSETNRRNAAFCAGELCKNGGVSSLKYFGDVLRCIYPLFGESEPDAAVRDNAAGAVARMIMAHQESIPLNQVLPVFVKVLPLKEDREESMPVYSCICSLVLSSNPQIAPLVPDLVNVFAQVAISPLETPEVKGLIGRAFAHLLSIYGQQMQPLLGNTLPTVLTGFPLLAEGFCLHFSTASSFPQWSYMILQNGFGSVRVLDTYMQSTLNVQKWWTLLSAHRAQRVGIYRNVVGRMANNGLFQPLICCVCTLYRVRVSLRKMEIIGKETKYIAEV